MKTHENLQELLGALEDSVRSDQLGIADIVARVTAVLEFLNVPGNNTNKNCETIDAFIVSRVLSDATGSRNLTRLPVILAEIIEDMGMCLHDTHSSPEISAAFHSRPEQLLARIQRFQETENHGT